MGDHSRVYWVCARRYAQTQLAPPMSPRAPLISQAVFFKIPLPVTNIARSLVSSEVVQQVNVPTQWSYGHLHVPRRQCRTDQAARACPVDIDRSVRFIVL